MTTTYVLLKKNFTAMLFTNKPALKSACLAGRLVQLTFNIETTKYELSDYIKVSKKHRSNVVESVSKDLFQYAFTGICIAVRKEQLLLRNVLNNFPFEINIPFFSPMIDNIHVISLRSKFKKLIRNKYYYLRLKPLPLSNAPFSYVVGMVSPDYIPQNIYEDSPNFIQF